MKYDVLIVLCEFENLFKLFLESPNFLKRIQSRYTVQERVKLKSHVIECMMIAQYKI